MGVLEWWSIGVMEQRDGEKHKCGVSAPRPFHNSITPILHYSVPFFVLLTSLISPITMVLSTALHMS